MDPLTIAAIAQAGYGIYRNIKATLGINKMAMERKPTFMDAAGPLYQNKQLGMLQYQRGLSPSAVALGEQQFGGARAGQYRMATEMSGGQLGSALSRMGASNSAQFGLGMAAQGQSASERGLGMVMGANQQISGLQSRQVGAEMDNYNQRQQAFGQAKKESGQDVLGAVGGYQMGKLGMQQQELNRQAYGNMYGQQQAAPSNFSGGLPQVDYSFNNYYGNKLSTPKTFFNR
jgi:hypothetical protein